ncbi:MAG: hypothetical protein JWL91_1914 [Sphingomonas bacterium]|jgi:hypothetical protein|nr:hypothetical protein [Sphingomonas bacterium]MDB5690038.1 hypothetical protein [Sphingomonas bacterium]
MSLMLLTAAAMLGVSGGAVANPEPQEIIVRHRGAELQARYRAEVDVRTRQIGSAPPTRVGSARCVWTATVAVHREVGEPGGPQVATLARKIDEKVLATGYRPGGCMETRKGIAADAGRHGPAAESHLRAVAQRDQHQLTAELDQLHGLVAQRD